MELYRLFFQISLTLVLYGWELQLKWHFLLPVRMGRGWAYGFKTHRICVIHHLNKSEHPRRDAMLLWLLLGIIVLCWRNNCVNCFFPYWVLLLEDVWLVVVGTWGCWILSFFTHFRFPNISRVPFWCIVLLSKQR